MEQIHFKSWKEQIERNEVTCGKSFDLFQRGISPVGTYNFQHHQKGSTYFVDRLDIYDTRTGDVIICERFDKWIRDGENNCSGVFNPFNESKS